MSPGCEEDLIFNEGHAITRAQTTRYTRHRWPRVFVLLYMIPLLQYSQGHRGEIRVSERYLGTRNTCPKHLRIPVQH